MPPKITAEQAAHFAEALAKGSPTAARSRVNVLGEKVREMV